MSNLQIADRIYTSRLFLGTGKFGSMSQMTEAVKASGSRLVTMALKRIDHQSDSDLSINCFTLAGCTSFAQYIRSQKCTGGSIGSTTGKRSSGNKLAETGNTSDPRYLLPDPIETLKATEELAKLGFIVMPYIHADPVLCKRLENAGTAVVMPLGAPIGSNKGLRTLDFLEIIIEQSNVPVVVDAGIGAPSDAAKAMEMGADAVLVNTAIAVAGDPVQMAMAFKEAVIAGRRGYEAQLGAVHSGAVASSPLTSFL